MKKIFKYSPIIIALPLLLLVSCKDDDAIRVPELEDGATFRIQVEPEFSFFNFAEIASAKLVMNLFTVNDNIEKSEIYMEYFNLGNDSTYSRRLWRTINPNEFDDEGAIYDVEFTSQDLSSLFNIDIADITGGDRLDVFNFTYLTDGRVFPDTVFMNEDVTIVNINQDLQNSAATNSFSIGFTAYVACPTDPTLWEGDYTTAVSNVNSFCGLLDCSSTRDATITFVGAPEPFRYRTSSHDAGLWGSFDPGSLDRAGNFYDICEVPLLLASATGYGDHVDDPANPNPPRDPDTGVIVMNWCNFFNPVCGTTTYTPK
jgi:hypothetical protein